MKKYEYVNVQVGSFFTRNFTKHREIIDEWASKVYRYVGYIPTSVDIDGKVYEMDLIFEIDEE